MPICLYCKGSDGPFNSVEHVIPKSLGNQSLRGKKPVLLPKGIVRDRCNNGNLSVLDNALIEFPPISMMQKRCGIRSKRGALPSTKLSNARIRNLSPGNILIESGSSKKAFQFDRRTGRFGMQLRSNRRMAPTYCRTLTRGLFKTARGLRQRARVLSPPGRAVPSTSRRSCATTDPVCPPERLGHRAAGTL